MIFYSFIHKVEYFIGYLLCLIKQHLLLIVLPVERQVLDVDAVPVVVELHACGVYDPLHFVWDYEFEVLGTVLVADEQSVLYFYDANEVLILQVFLLVQELLSHLMLLWLLHVEVVELHKVSLINSI